MNNSIDGLVKINPKGKIEKSGIPVGYDYQENNLLVDTTSSHRLIIGSMGSEKTQVVTLPMMKMMIRAEESFIVTDSLGKLYYQIGGPLKEEGYETIVLNFKDYQYGNHWNPFSDICSSYQQGDKNKTEELLHSFMKNIFLNQLEVNEPFWDYSAANYFIGLVYLLLEEGKTVTFQAIYDLSQEGNEKIWNKSYFMKYYENRNERISYTYLSNILNAPNQTRESILSVFYQKISPFIINSDLVEMMNITDFDNNNFGNKKVAVFIILPENFRNKMLISLCMKQIYENNSKNEKSLHFLLDDFQQLEEISDFSTMLENALRKNICFTVMVPSFHTFYEKYGEKEGKRVKDLFTTILYLLSNDINTIFEMVSLCGTIKEKGKELPFITERELRTLNCGEGVFLKSRSLPKNVFLKVSSDIEWNLKDCIPELHFHQEVKVPKFEFQNLVLSELI